MVFLHKDCKKCSDVWATADSWHDKRQIKRMASKEGRLYALAGIPLGLVIGVLIGFIGCPDGFRLKTTVIYAVLIAAVAFVTVNIAIFKPVRVAMNTSPVEGAKYLAYAGKAKAAQNCIGNLRRLIWRK